MAIYEYLKDDGSGEVRDRSKDLSFFEFQIDATLKQYGRPYFQDRCDVDSCFEMEFLTVSALMTIT